MKNLDEKLFKKLNLIYLLVKNGSNMIEGLAKDCQNP